MYPWDKGLVIVTYRYKFPLCKRKCVLKNLVGLFDVCHEN